MTDLGPLALAEALLGAPWAVVHGDCAAILPMMAAKSVAHVIQDPPYSPAVHALGRRMLRGSGGRVAKGQRSGRGEVREAPLGFDPLSAELRRLVATHSARVARRWILTFSDMEGRDPWQSDLERAGARHVRAGVWWKVCPQPQLTGDRPGSGCEAVEVAHARGERLRWNGGGLPAFWSHAIATDRNATGARVHTTQKPLSLMLELVEQFSDPGDLVLDPFCGSGTTGVACIRLGRRFIGIEKDEKYAAIAREQLEAESKGLTLTAARAGQRSLFG